MTNLAKVQTVEFIDVFGEAFEADSFPFDGGWVIRFDHGFWVLDHDVYPVRIRPAGYYVEFNITKDGGITHVEEQNLQNYSYFNA